jgi:plasmid stability protein
VIQKSESRELDKVIVRLPDGMRDQLKAMAQAGGRSLNAEIVERLKASFQDQAYDRDDQITKRLDQFSMDMWEFRQLLEKQNKPK